MSDPANTVHPQLLRHLHLVVNKPVPLPASPDPALILDTLLQATSAVQHSNTVTWRFFAQPPPDGTNLLVHQSPQMGNAFASDGYMWLDPEVTRTQEMKGYTLEMYANRSGYRPGYENRSAHSRRRYRLAQHPSIWLISYRPADPRDQVSINTQAIPDHLRPLFQEREMLVKNQAQLVRKEFMLYDAPSFPTVMLPGGGPAQHPTQTMEYPSNVMAHLNKNQQAAYKQQQQQHQEQQQQQRRRNSIMPEDPNSYDYWQRGKRPRRGSYDKVNMSTTAIPRLNRQFGRQGHAGEDEIETGLDYMDAITPRELALHRYVQHHEWLEEILNSPYDTHRIVPPELGLGRKGELESLTRDFFNAPVNLEKAKKLDDPREINSLEEAKANKPVVDEVLIPRVGRLEAEKAADFTEKANTRIANLNAEIEKMKEDHAKLMLEIEKESGFKTAEKSLRAATSALLDKKGHTDQQQLDGLIRDLETQKGKKLQSVQAIELLDKGGYEDVVPDDRVESQDNEMTQDHEMTGLGVDDEPRTLPPSAEIPPVIPEPTQTDGAVGNEGGHLAQANPEEGPVEDNPMTELPPPADPAELSTEDFVLVSKDDAMPSPTNDEAKEGETEAFPALQTEEPQIGGNELTDFDTDQGVSFEAADFGGGIDFGDMDTAGDALSGYAQEIANMGGNKSENLILDSPTIQNPSPGLGEHSTQDQPPAS